MGFVFVWIPSINIMVEETFIREYLWKISSSEIAINLSSDIYIYKKLWEQ